MSFERSDCLEVNVRHCGANASTRIIGADAASSGRIVDIFMFLLCFYENIDTLRMVQIGSSSEEEVVLLVVASVAFMVEEARLKLDVEKVCVTPSGR